LIRLNLSDALSDSIALGLSESSSDRQEQFGEPIARNVAAEIE
jgi:hypothetical protein